MATLISDLIHIPERVHEGDFVINLSTGVLDPALTLRDYVVTPQLVKCFDDALGFVKGAMDSRTSKASYLHGSFGAGKSHFMAVLHLLLQHNPTARSIPELHEVISRHPWAEGKRFLLVPYHLIGARSMETAILGGYVDHVRRVHPEAPVPGVYPAAEIFENARRQRQLLGDEKFFAELNRGTSGQGGGKWGKLEATWTAENFERIAGTTPLSEGLSQKQGRGENLTEADRRQLSDSGQRSRLIGALIQAFFSAYHGVSTVKDEAFVPLDHGLSIISQHARDLGYDGLVLFLDELVLWLASRAGDVEFVHREGQKLAKLVESQRAERPIPVISFVARQRDLRELVGDRLTGAEQLRFGDALRHWEGRFHTITLEDRNLATITARRILRPRHEAARQELASAFQQALTARREVIDTLCTTTGDQEMFRQVYPFTPALIQTLVALSSALQRHRTALKLMLMLLVQQRATLTLGQVIPVGDLWDVLDEREKALTDVLENTFKKARALYLQKLRPELKRQHQIFSDEEQFRQTTDPGLRRQWDNFVADERLAKTLLLSALVPEVEALKDLTAAKLAALNYGSVVSPIPGREAQLVLNKVRAWAAKVGEIRIAEGNNPFLSVKLTGVDIEGLLDRVLDQDNSGNRQRKVRELLFEALDIPEGEQIVVERTSLWRGTPRTFDVVYTNVRTATPDRLASRGARWKIVVDFPFDDVGYTPHHDKAQLDTFLQQRPGGCRTVVWLPRFLSSSAQQDLGVLVRLDYLLRGDNFDRNATHLAPVERAEARSLVANQRSALNTRVKQYLEAAYGVGSSQGDGLDTSSALDETFYSLSPTFYPRSPGVATLSGALEAVMDQALTHQFRAHPLFKEEVKTAALRRTLEITQQAARAPQHRISVERTDRRLLEGIVAPLRLGTMGETHFVLETTWRDLIERRRHEAHLQDVPVRQVREWIDPPDEPLGLPVEVSNLLILVWAEQTHRLFFHHGGPAQVSLERLDDDMIVKEQHLPTLEEWNLALERGRLLFGVPGSPLLNPSNVASWAAGVRKFREQYLTPATRLPSLLREVATSLGEPGATCLGWNRMKGAEDGASLITRIGGVDDVALVKVVVSFTHRGTDPALARSITSSEGVGAALAKMPMTLVKAALNLEGTRRGASQLLLEDLVHYLAADELVLPLTDRLAQVAERALRLVTDKSPEEQAAEKEKQEREQAETRRRWEAEQQEREERARQEEARRIKEQAEREAAHQKRVQELEEQRQALEKRLKEEHLKEMQEREAQKRQREEQQKQEEEQRKRNTRHTVELELSLLTPVHKLGERPVTSSAEIDAVAKELTEALKRRPGVSLRLVWLEEA